MGNAWQPESFDDLRRAESTSAPFTCTEVFHRQQDRTVVIAVCPRRIVKIADQSSGSLRAVGQTALQPLWVFSINGRDKRKPWLEWISPHEKEHGSDHLCPSRPAVEIVNGQKPVSNSIPRPWGWENNCNFVFASSAHIDFRIKPIRGRLNFDALQVICSPGHIRE